MLSNEGLFCMMVSMPYILLLAAVLLNGLANFFLKAASLKETHLSLASVAANWQLLVGLFFFALNVVFYFLALRNLKLAVAYPVMVGASFALAFFLSWLFLGEIVNTKQFIGILLILSGIIVVLGFSS